MSRFVAVDDGIEVTMDTPEVAILSRLPALLGSVGADPADPAPERLHPAAYRDDPELAAEVRRLTAPDIEGARTTDLEAFLAKLQSSIDGVLLSRDEAAAWLRVFGAARIVLAARNGLFDLDDLSEAPRQDPDVALVMLLGVYQGSLSEMLLAGMDS